MQMTKSNRETAIPPNGTPCLFSRKPPSLEKARGDDDTITSSTHGNIIRRANPMRVHVKTLLPSKRSSQTMHIYTNEVKTMEDMTSLVIDILGIYNKRPSEVEIYYEGKFYVPNMTLLRDEDVIEVKPICTILKDPNYKRGLFTLIIISCTIIIFWKIVKSSMITRDVAIPDL
jgi:hypothetical protein